MGLRAIAVSTAGVQPRTGRVVAWCVRDGDEERGLFTFEQRDRVDAAFVEDRAQRERCFFEQLVTGAADRAYEDARDTDPLGIVRSRRPGVHADAAAVHEPEDRVLRARG